MRLLHISSLANRYKLKLIAILFLFVVRNAMSQSVTAVYKNPSDSTENYYLKVVPKGSIESCIVFIPGLFQTPEELLLETGIEETANEKGCLLIVPIQTKTSLHFEKRSMEFLTRVVSEVFSKYQIKNKNLIIGGFSSGGALAMLYSEKVLTHEINGVEPKGLFMVDSPLDYQRVSLNELKSATEQELDFEKNKYDKMPTYFIFKFKESFGQNYLTNKEFLSSSPYVRSDTACTNIRSLVNLPVRFYSEPDLEFFYLRNPEKFEPNFLNILDGAPLIKDLKRIGNTKSELIITKNKGYRHTQKERHPHSVSIVDPEELLKWIDRILKTK